MKSNYVASLILAIAFLLSPSLAHSAGGFKGQKFQQVTFYEHGGKGAMSGKDAGNAKAIVDGDVMAIPAGSVIEKVYVIVDTAITGTTDLDIGDDDAANGYVDGSASVTLGAAGLYGWSVGTAGAYLQSVHTGGGSSYLVPAAKFYSAAGKEIKLDATTASDAGAFRVVVEGYRL